METKHLKDLDLVSGSLSGQFKSDSVYLFSGVSAQRSSSVRFLLQPLQARPSNQEKNILEGKEALVSGVRFSTCSSRSMYLGFASLE